MNVTSSWITSRYWFFYGSKSLCRHKP